MKKTNFKRIIASALCLATLAVPFSTSVSAAPTKSDVVRIKENYIKNAYISLPPSFRWGNLHNQERRPMYIGSQDLPTINAAVKRFYESDVASKLQTYVGTWVLGDVNHNGKVEITDLPTLKSMVVAGSNTNISDVQIALGDLNNDNIIDMTDVTILSIHLVNGNVSY